MKIKFYISIQLYLVALMMMTVCDNRSLNAEWTVSTRQAWAHGYSFILLSCCSGIDSDGGSAHEMTSASPSPGFASSASFFFYSHQFSVISMTCDFEERHAYILDEYDAYESTRALRQRRDPIKQR